MTKARFDVCESLARRGHREYWATEHEAAALSGMSANAFRDWLKSPEAKGFPSPDPRNGKRAIPAILAFWGLDKEHPAPEIDEAALENWG